MRIIVIALAALVLVPVAHAAPVTMVSRELPLGPDSARSLAAAMPRFNMVALHWQGRGVPLFRTRSDGGRWSAWQAADDDGNRRGAWRLQVNPAWTGPSDAIRYRVQGRVTRLRAYFLWSPLVHMSARRLTLAGSPAIIPRSGWGADEEIRRAPPLYADTLRFALVHHTVSSNNYNSAESASIVRGIEVYHVQGNGWNDIGYNFLVDKYGQVFEGRYGGIDRNVVGAHSAGFNTGSVGVAVIGTYSNAAIPTAAKTALEQLLAWRLDLAHVDPLATTTVASGGNSKFRAGTQVSLRTISGHRDTYATECPGNALYAELPAIASNVAALGLPKLYSPLVTGAVGGPIRFTGRLSTSLPWTVTVTDASGRTVATGTGASTAVDWTWDATAAAPGAYAWTIAAGSSVLSARGTIGGKLAALAISDAKAVPTLTVSASQISYTLTVSSMVTATLVDASGATVTTLFTEPKTAGKQTFSFSVAPTVADGAYTIQLQALAADGTQATASVPIQIDRSVLDFSAAPAAISPNGDGIQDTVALYFDLAQPQVASLTVLRAGANLATVVTGSYPAGLPVTASWDGTVAGKAVADGLYTLALTTAAGSRTLPLVVDRKPPALRPISWRQLRFAVGEPGTVSLVVGTRTYVKKVKAPARIYFWLKSRPKHYRIRAQDAAGNVTTLKR